MPFTARLAATPILDERFDDLDAAMIEHGVFGGTCLDVGCIPTGSDSSSSLPSCSSA